MRENRTNTREFVRAKDLLQDLSETIQAEKLEKATIAPQMAYHELADVPVRETDLIEQLEQNIANVEMLRSRFQFVMREIRYLVKM